MSSRYPCIPCSHKANQGVLYPLEKAFIYAVKPRPIYIRFEEVEHVRFQAAGKKNIEFEISLKSGDMKKCDFQSIEREEYPRLFKFCQEKQLRIKNINGGSHAGTKLTIQEFMILPYGVETFSARPQPPSNQALYQHVVSTTHTSPTVAPTSAANVPR